MFIRKLPDQILNVILRTPRILDSSCRNTYRTLSSMEKDILGQRSFFRDQYARELVDVIKIIKNANGFGDFSELLGKNPKRAKEVMQHIYTFNQSFFDKFKESFHIQNTTPSDHTKRNTIYEEYHKNMTDEISKISTLKPDFGYCDACENYLDRKQKKNNPKINELNDDFWDYTKW